MNDSAARMYGVYVGTAVPTTARRNGVSFSFAEQRGTYWLVWRSPKHPPASPVPTRRIHNRASGIIMVSVARRRRYGTHELFTQERIDPSIHKRYR
jgi:hypothetical protein